MRREALPVVSYEIEHEDGGLISERQSRGTHRLAWHAWPANRLVGRRDLRTLKYSLPAKSGNVTGRPQQKGQP